MSDFQDLLRELGGSRISELSQALGADEDRSRAALAAGLPAILAALKRNASRPDGAEALARALERDHDGSVLDQLSSVLSGGGGAAGDGILRHAFGDRRSAVEEAVSRQSGLGRDQVSKLLALLAPLVMGQLGKARRGGGIDAGGLADLLDREGSAVAPKGGGLGAFASLLDRDGDGSIADDLGGLARGFLDGMRRDR